MICCSCQKEIAEGSNYCSCCGANQHAPAAPRVSRRLMRSFTDLKIAGVCGGLAEYLDADSTIVRLLWVLAALFPPTLIPAFVGYFMAWLIVPRVPVPIPATHTAPSSRSAQPA